MARSSIQKLPVEIVIEVKRRLRSGSFDQADILLWVKEQGYEIKKSAFSRYAIKLRTDDKAIGIDREILSVQGADVAALFEELAHIKARETEILTQLKLLIIKIR